MADWTDLPTVRKWLGVQDRSQDDLLTSLISAATSACRNFIGRDLEEATLSETYDGNGSGILPLALYPITDVTSLTIDGLTLRRAAYLTPGWSISEHKTALKLTRGLLFYQGQSNVAVTYTGGYATIPGEVAQATLLTVVAMFNARAADPNLSSESTGGVFGATFWQSGPGAIPPAARSHLAPYRRVY